MKQTSEAIKKAIEAIESAAPEAWRLTVEGYRAEAVADLLTHLLLSVTFLAGALLLMRLCRVPLAVVWQESSKGILAQNLDRKFRSEGTMVLAAVVIAIGLIASLSLLCAVPGDIARIMWAEPIAAKQLVEGALR